MRPALIIFTLITSVFLYCTKIEENINMDFEVICRDDSIQTYNSPPPSIIYFHLSIQNTGTALDSVNVYFSDYVIPNGWTLQFCNAHG